MTEFTFVVNVQGVVCRGGEYLLIERGADEDHAAGLLSFPGGKVEAPPEDRDVLEATVERELFEEVGVRVGDVEYVYSTTFETDDGARCLNVVTNCSHLEGEAYPKAVDEVAAVHWLAYEDLLDRADVPEYTKRHAKLAAAMRSAD